MRRAREDETTCVRQPVQQQLVCLFEPRMQRRLSPPSTTRAGWVMRRASSSPKVQLVKPISISNAVGASRNACSTPPGSTCSSAARLYAGQRARKNSSITTSAPSIRYALRTTQQGLAIGLAACGCSRPFRNVGGSLPPLARTEDALASAARRSRVSRGARERPPSDRCSPAARDGARSPIGVLSAWLAYVFGVAARRQSRRCLIGVKLQPFTQVQRKRSVRVDMRLDQRRQSAQIVRRHAGRPCRLHQHAPEHEHVDVDQAALQQVQRKHRQLLFVSLVRADLAAFAIQDEAVGAVPVLDHVQPVMDLASQGLHVEVPTQKDRFDGLAELSQRLSRSGAAVRRG